MQILEISSTVLNEALVDIGYHGQLFSPEEIKQLQNQIKKICETLLASTFGGKTQVEESIWCEKLQNSLLSKSLTRIRNKIFKDANVKTHHINEREARRLLTRK